MALKTWSKQHVIPYKVKGHDYQYIRVLCIESNPFISTPRILSQKALKNYQSFNKRPISVHGK